jgi:hypothetical protein
MPLGDRFGGCFQRTPTIHETTRRSEVEKLRSIRHNLVMAEHDRHRRNIVITLYVTLAVGWVAFARWIAPPLLFTERPGGTWAAIRHYIQRPPALFLTRDAGGRWREFSVAVLIALVFHLTILLILRRYDFRAAETCSLADVRARRRVNLLLLIFSLAFLAVTVLSGPYHDYYFYLQMWYEVRQGHDPWFLVFGKFGHVPLNAYGPLFNLLAGLAWINPLAPKLLFAQAYILFSVSQIKGFKANHPGSGVATIALMALFWNPFPWVEIAIRGHFDVLLGLFCLGAIRAWTRGHDVVSGSCLALGVLLKYLPVVLLPFLAFDGGRLRPRFLTVGVLTIAAGMGLSFAFWGPSILAPLTFAATRQSNSLSIFFFLRGRYSPLKYFTIAPNIDELAPFILVIALVHVWYWFRVRQPDIEAACVVAVATTVLFYHTGFPQYQMAPFVLGASWAVRHWRDIGGRIFRIMSVALYFVWLGAFGLYYGCIDDDGAGYYWDVARELVGLPSFLIGCGFIATVMRSAKRQSSSSSDDSSWSSC